MSDDERVFVLYHLLAVIHDIEWKLRYSRVCNQFFRYLSPSTSDLSRIRRSRLLDEVIHDRDLVRVTVHYLRAYHLRACSDSEMIRVFCYVLKKLLHVLRHALELRELISFILEDHF